MVCMKIHTSSNCVILNLTCMNHHASPKSRWWQFGTGVLVSFVAHGPLLNVKAESKCNIRVAFCWILVLFFSWKGICFSLGFFTILYMFVYICNPYPTGQDEVGKVESPDNSFTIRLFKTTVDSFYLEVKGTLWNTSRYPYFDIPDL